MTNFHKNIEPLSILGYDDKGNKTVPFVAREDGALEIGGEVKTIEEWDEYFKENMRHEELIGKILVMENICLYDAMRQYIITSKIAENGGTKGLLHLFDFSQEG